MVYNAMAAAAVGVINDMELEDIKKWNRGIFSNGNENGEDSPFKRSRSN